MKGRTRSFRDPSRAADGPLRRWEETLRRSQFRLVGLHLGAHLPRAEVEVTEPALKGFHVQDLRIGPAHSIVPQLRFEQTNKAMSQLTYRILLTKEPEGGFTVNVPALPGCVTFGENIEHAMAMAREAIELYVETLQAEGDLVPDDSQTFEYSLVLAS
jgi:antitoxin HicB